MAVRNVPVRPLAGHARCQRRLIRLRRRLVAGGGNAVQKRSAKSATAIATATLTTAATCMAATNASRAARSRSLGELGRPAGVSATGSRVWAQSSAARKRNTGAAAA